jgi:hypothetical protein
MTTYVSLKQNITVRCPYLSSAPKHQSYDLHFVNCYAQLPSELQSSAISLSISCNDDRTCFMLNLCHGLTRTTKTTPLSTRHRPRTIPHFLKSSTHNDMPSCERLMPGLMLTWKDHRNRISGFSHSPTQMRRHIRLQHPPPCHPNPSLQQYDPSANIVVSHTNLHFGL